LKRAKIILRATLGENNLADIVQQSRAESAVELLSRASFMPDHGLAAASRVLAVRPESLHVEVRIFGRVQRLEDFLINDKPLQNVHANEGNSLPGGLDAPGKAEKMES